MIDWTKFAADYTPMAQSVAYEILRDWHGAQDVAAAAISSCWLYWRRGLLDDAGSHRKFVRACVRNAAFSELRKRKSRPCRHLCRDVEDDRAGERVDAEQLATDTRRVQDAIRTMTGLPGSCARLFYLSGYSRAQVGAQLSIAPGTVRGQLCLAKKRLRSALNDISLD